eukprot:3408054-Pyramimonas_sp.AAC.1
MRRSAHGLELQHHQGGLELSLVYVARSKSNARSPAWAESLSAATTSRTHSRPRTPTSTVSSVWPVL